MKTEAKNQYLSGLSARAIISEPIAIVGIGCRLPGRVDSPNDYWEMLKGGVDAITEVPASRYRVDKFYDPDVTKSGKTNSKWGGFIQQPIEEFDAGFFGFSPREAESLDPLQRWLMEVSWEAFEDAGQPPEGLRGKNVGVFIGAFTLDYNVMQLGHANRDFIEAHTGTGGAMTMLSARLSYLYDLRGPSLALDTACSSSMVAIHLACQSIWAGESSMALAGGVNAMFTPEYSITNSKAGMLSPDGRCKSFDASANGYVRGEGAAVVLLKPLSAALENGDHIYALIRSTACNQDGRSDGITVPNGEAQEAVMREACRRAGITGAQIQYVEAHGTGTSVGDPIEVNALAKVLGENRSANDNCMIGSVKTNIGHTEAVAGVASLIKVALCLKHAELPATLHFKEPNPKIPFEQLGIEVVRDHQRWPNTDTARLSGINCFGFGGTNTHIIVSEAQPSPVSDHKTCSNYGFILPLSAKNPSALLEYAESVRKFLATQDDATLGRLCYSMAQRRTHHEYRTALVAGTVDEMLAALDRYISENEIPKARSPAQSGLVFVFSGMGPQWWAMARQLMCDEGVFQQTVAKVDRLFAPLAGWSIIEALLQEEDTSLMKETAVAQPTNFAIQVGLLALYESFGIHPVASIGHSAGEPAAAYAAGIYSLEDATRIIFHRSRLQQQVSGRGGMLAVALSRAEADKLLSSFKGRVSIAAINSPTSLTLGGEEDALNLISSDLQKKGVFCRHLAVKVAYHTHFMNPIRQELITELEATQSKSAHVPVYSTVTGLKIEGHEFSSQYWWENIRNPVLFHSAISEMVRDGYQNFLEIAPHPVLKSSIEETLMESGADGGVIFSLKRNSDDRINLLNSLAEIYKLGENLNWSEISPKQAFCQFPKYPWQRERYWKESAESIRYRLEAVQHPLLSRRTHPQVDTWELDVDLYSLAYLNDHKIQGTVVFPGAGYVELAWAAGKQAFGKIANAMSIEFKNALYISDNEVPRLLISFERNSGAFEIWSQPISKALRTIHASGKIWDQQRTRQNSLDSLPSVLDRCPNHLPSDVCYTQFSRIGLEYGPLFQGLSWLRQGEMEAVAKLQIHNDIESNASDYKIHPVVLDQCFQVLAAALPFPKSNAEAKVYMPVSVEEGFVYQAPQSEMHIVSRITDYTDDYLKGDIVVLDDHGRVVVEIFGCKAVRLDQQAGAGVRDIAQGLYQPQWIESLAEIRHEVGVDEHFLIFSDSNGLGERLGELLASEGRHYTLLTRGKEQRVSAHRVSLDESNPSAIDLALAQLNEIPQKKIRLIYLWGLDWDTPSSQPQGLVPQNCYNACSLFLQTIQALERSSIANRCGVLLVTKGAQTLEGDSPTERTLAQTTLWGLGRVIGHQEHADLWAGMLDLDPNALSDEARVLLDELDANPGEDQVAYRNNCRHVLRLRQLDEPSASLPARIRSDASYVITGGLGSLGLLVAEWLAERGARHLVLVGRSRLPARSEWSELRNDHPRYPVIAVLRRLEKLGINIELATLDVSDEEAIRDLLQQRERVGCPPVRGLIHSAGMASPMLLSGMTKEHLREIFQPKVNGGWALHQALETTKLDFFILFSSVASVVTSPGQGAYAAANAYLDGLAHFRLSQGLPAISINWGPWGEVGMATQFNDLKTYFENRGMFPMRSNRGIDALEQVIGLDYPQVLVMAADWELVRSQNYPPGVVPAFLADIGAPHEGSGAHSEPECAESAQLFITQTLPEADPEVRVNLMASYLLDLAASVLRIGAEQRLALSPDIPFNRLGLDSMMAIELKNLMSKRLATPIAVVDLLNGTACMTLAQKLIDQLGLGSNCDAPPEASVTESV